MKLSIFVFLLTLILSSSIFSNPIHAQVSAEPMNSEPTEWSLILRGEITRKTFDSILRYETVLKKVGHKIIGVFLNSPGGDIHVAMKIGRWIRKRRLIVVINEGETCKSACIYVYAGGNYRMMHGKLFVHRPYSTTIDTSKVTREEWDQKWKSLKRESRSFFEEMNVNPDLAELMWRIPPSKSYQFTEDDFDKYQLFFQDPSDEDYTRTTWAKRLGITRKELERRLVRAGTVCKRDIDESRFKNDETYRNRVMYDEQHDECRKNIVERGN